MKSTSRKLLLSLSTFLFALVALFGATFAWFTQADTATIETLNINVTAGENLKIEDATGAFVTTLTPVQVAALYNKQHTTGGLLFDESNTYTYNNLRVVPLTSLLGMDFYTEQAGTVYENAGYSYTPGTAGIFYFDLVLNFQASIPMNVHLKADSIDDILSSMVDIDGLGDIQERGGAYRIAFIDFDTDATIFIWERDATDSTSWNSLLLANGNVQTPYPTWDPVIQQLTRNSFYNGTVESLTNSLIYQFSTAGTKEILVRVWLEGWDKHALDYLKDTQFSMGLQFVGMPL
jgi:hypothetical protein